MIDNSVGETNFPHKLSLTNRQVGNFRKAFADYLSTDIKLLKTQLSKIVQLGGFLGRLLGPLVKSYLPYMKNIIQSLAKLFCSIRINSSSISSRCKNTLKNLSFWNSNTSNIKWWNGRHYENS